MNHEALELISNIIYNICTQVVSVFMLRMYYQTFFEKKKNTLLVWIAQGAFFFLPILLDPVSVISPIWLRLMFTISLTIVFSLSVAGSLFRRIVFAVLYNAVWMLCELLIAYFFISMHIDWDKQDIAGSVLSKIFMLLLVMALKGFFSKEAFKELPGSYNAMLVALPVGSMSIALHLFALSTKIDDVQYVYVSFIMVFVLLLVNVMMFQIYWKLLDNQELKRKNAIYQLEIGLYGMHIKEKESAMMEIRQVRHDLKHQLIFLLELSEKKEYAQLEDYLKRMADWEPLEGLMVARTDHFMIDALVNYKYSFAKSRGIAFRAKMDLPTSLPFEDDDLCIILGNALDNAIEAALRGNVETPYVDLNMKYDSGNLIVIIENSFDGEIRKDKRGRILTRKSESENHGIGIDSMKKAAQKYHGFFDMQHDSGKFCLKFILYSGE